MSSPAMTYFLRMLKKVRSFEESSGVLSRPAAGALEVGVEAPDLSREPGLELSGVALVEAAFEDEGDIVLWR